MENRIFSSAKLFTIIFVSILYLEILFKVRVLNFEFDLLLTLFAIRKNIMPANLAPYPIGRYRCPPPCKKNRRSNTKCQF